MPHPRTSAPRADRERNHARLLAAASRLIESDGADVSFEEIARQAGVGSATVHRHFHTRQALLEEVFSARIDQLSQRATELARHDGSTALFSWLEELTAYASGTRGLSTSLTADYGDPAIAASRTCRGKLKESAELLAALAVTEGVLRQGVSSDDLLRLANGISLATPGEPETAQRLVRLAVAGLAIESPPAE